MTHTHWLYESGIREVLKGRHWALLKNVSYCFLNFIYLSLLLAGCDSSTSRATHWTGLCLSSAGLRTGLGSVHLLFGGCCFQHNIILRRPALVWSATGLKGFFGGICWSGWWGRWGSCLRSTVGGAAHFHPLQVETFPDLLHTGTCFFYSKYVALCVAIGHLTNTWGPLVDKSRVAQWGCEPQTHQVPNGQFVVFTSSSFSSRGQSWVD